MRLQVVDDKHHKTANVPTRPHVESNFTNATRPHVESNSASATHLHVESIPYTIASHVATIHGSSSQQESMSNPNINFLQPIVINHIAQNVIQSEPEIVDYVEFEAITGSSMESNFK